MRKILDGKAIAQTIKDKIKEEIKHTNAKIGFVAILIGNDEASKIYVNLKQKVATEIGIDFQKITMTEDISEKELIDTIKNLNTDTNIHGILVQLPLPPHLNPDKIIQQIDVSKDADGFHPENEKLIYTDNYLILSPPISAIMRMIEETGENISGKKCAIIANSEKFANPIKYIIEKQNCEAQIFIYEKNICSKIGYADIIISATGNPCSIKRKDIKENSILIDVGISRLPDGKVSGDFDFEDVKEKAGYITPVPGGIGPLTIAYLFYNTLKLYKNQNAK